MSNQSRKIGPELDRENAHFSVSEAMIAEIELVCQFALITLYYTQIEEVGKVKFK